jgi:hypothetical protein
VEDGRLGFTAPSRSGSDLLGVVPAALRGAAEAAVGAGAGGEADPAAVAAAELKLTQQLCWRLGNRFVFLSGVTVRSATALAAAHAEELAAAHNAARARADPDFDAPRSRADLLGLCYVLAAAGEELPPAAAVADVQTVLRRLWKVKWSNFAFVPFLFRAPSSTQCPGRAHILFDCPGAGRAVGAAVAGELTGAWAPPGGALRPEHLLPARPPNAALNSYVWDVVCLAAVGAIRHGLGRMNAPMLKPENRGPPPSRPPRWPRRAASRSTSSGSCSPTSAPWAWRLPSCTSGSIHTTPLSAGAPRAGRWETNRSVAVEQPGRDLGGGVEPLC